MRAARGWAANARPRTCTLARLAVPRGSGGAQEQEHPAMPPTAATDKGTTQRVCGGGIRHGNTRHDNRRSRTSRCSNRSKAPLSCASLTPAQPGCTPLRRQASFRVRALSGQQLRACGIPARSSAATTNLSSSRSSCCHLLRGRRRRKRRVCGGQQHALEPRPDSAGAHR